MEQDAASEEVLAVFMMYRGAVVGSKRKAGNPLGIVGELVVRVLLQGGNGSGKGG